MRTPAELNSTCPSAITRLKQQRRAKKYQSKKNKDLASNKHPRRLRQLRQPRSVIKSHLKTARIEVPEDDIAELIENWKSILKYCDSKKKYTIEQRIAFWKQLATAKYPMFEKKPSLIRHAGNGVFVTKWYPYCPVGALLPFDGVAQPSRPSNRDGIWAGGGYYLVLTPYEEPTVHFGNFVNNPVSSELEPEEYQRRVYPTQQRLDVQNCNLQGQMIIIPGGNNMHTFRMETAKMLTSGTELLGPYGRGYHAGYRREGVPVSSNDPPTPEPRPAAQQPRWPMWSSRT